MIIVPGLANACRLRPNGRKPLEALLIHAPSLGEMPSQIVSIANFYDNGYCFGDTNAVGSYPPAPASTVCLIWLVMSGSGFLIGMTRIIILKDRSILPVRKRVRPESDVGEVIIIISMISGYHGEKFYTQKETITISVSAARKIPELAFWRILRYNKTGWWYYHGPVFLTLTVPTPGP